MKGNKFFFFQISIIVGQILLNGEFGLIAIRWVNRTCCVACLLTCSIPGTYRAGEKQLQQSGF